MATQTRVWIPCTIKKGMFSSEVAVEIKIGDKVVSLFADQSLTKIINGKTHILVTLMGTNGEPDHQTILLPSECFETGSRWLSVHQALLKAA